jgi:uncharacterized protein (TIGR00369 family)
MTKPQEVSRRFGPPFQRHLDIEMAVGPNKEGVASIQINPEKHYGSRWVHGGMFGALVDVAAGIAVAQTVTDAITAIDGTIELKINYLRRAREGDLTATARVVHRGRRVVVTDVDITNDGTLCAKALASFMLSPTTSESSQV